MSLGDVKMLRTLLVAPLSALASTLLVGSGIAQGQVAAVETAAICTTMIGTLNDLQTKFTDLSGQYCLSGNIDASGTALSVFTPIGDASTPFNGTFDGKGHVINGLTLTSSGTQLSPEVDLGLFGRLAW